MVQRMKPLTDQGYIWKKGNKYYKEMKAISFMTPEWRRPSYDQNLEATKERRRLINSTNKNKIISEGLKKKSHKKSQKANAKLRKVFVIYIIKQGLIPLIEFLKREITIHEENGQKIQADNSHKKK